MISAPLQRNTRALVQVREAQLLAPRHAVRVHAGARAVLVEDQNRPVRIRARETVTRVADVVLVEVL